MLKATVVESNMDIEQCYDIRRSVFCGLMNMPSEKVFDAYDRSAIHAMASAGYKPVASGRLALRQDMWWLDLVAVLPAFRGRGVGRQVVECLVDEARRRKIRELRSDSPAQVGAFLARVGFKGGVLSLGLDKG